MVDQIEGLSNKAILTSVMFFSTEVPLKHYIQKFLEELEVLTDSGSEYILKRR